MYDHIPILYVVACFLTGAVPTFALLLIVHRTLLVRRTHLRHIAVVISALLFAILIYRAAIMHLEVGMFEAVAKTDRLKFSAVLGIMCMLIVAPLVSYAAVCLKAIPVEKRKAIFRFGSLEIWILILAGFLITLVFCSPQAFHHNTALLESTEDWSIPQLLWWNGGTTQPWRWWFGLGERIAFALIPCLLFYIVGLAQRIVALLKDRNISRSQ